MMLTIVIICSLQLNAKLIEAWKMENVFSGPISSTIFFTISDTLIRLLATNTTNHNINRKEEDKKMEDIFKILLGFPSSNIVSARVVL